MVAHKISHHFTSPYETDNLMQRSETFDPEGMAVLRFYVFRSKGGKNNMVIMYNAFCFFRSSLNSRQSLSWETRNGPINSMKLESPLISCTSNGSRQLPSPTTILLIRDHRFFPNTRLIIITNSYNHFTNHRFETSNILRLDENETRLSFPESYALLCINHFCHRKS